MYRVILVICYLAFFQTGCDSTPTKKHKLHEMESPKVITKLIAKENAPDDTHWDDYVSFTRSHINEVDSQADLNHSNMRSIFGIVDVISNTTLKDSETVVIRSQEYPEAVALEWVDSPVQEIEYVLSTGRSKNCDVIIFIKGEVGCIYRKGARILVQLDSRRDPYGFIRSMGDVYYQFVPKVVMPHDSEIDEEK